MRLPTLQGIIHRRILVNFRVDPQVIQQHLPARFRPKLQTGYAVAGICLIRLEHLRPKMLPEMIGFSSENAAHRVAVLWDDEHGVTHEGVFIPRRDSDSHLNYALGGRVFPGKHHRALFQVRESETAIRLSMRAKDATVAVAVAGRIATDLPSSSIFPSLAVASSFFETGALGYSLTGDPRRLDGIRLETTGWQVVPLAIQKVYSSYFADESLFPRGSAVFDHALLMRNITHQWHNVADLYV